MSRIPLCVDLDGTLIHSDLFVESFMQSLRTRPLQTVCRLFRQRNQRAALKDWLANASDIDASTLPYNHTLIAWLRGERDAGRSLVLVTASNRRLADAVAEHLDLFD
ncbi:hypothetical protein OAS86_06475, partial [Gammaproteobacteria bacterium]|nr:hypothetical protein [Gammaproteobacteria bacterium]